MLEIKKSFIKKTGRIIIDTFLLVYGIAYYWLHRKKPANQRTPSKSHLSMIRFFCLTRGRSNDFFSKCISLFDKPLSLPHRSGILGDFSQDDINTIAQHIASEGYYIFDKKLPPEMIEQLKAFSLEQEYVLRKLDNDDPNTPPRRIRYDRTNPQSTVYDLPGDTVNSNAQVQALLCDHSILSVAQAYLKTSPKIDPATLLWSAAFGNQPQVNSAQLFHFDMDRFKWIKFFIFLTDVTMENGPHVFVGKSHRTQGIPRNLLQAGYVRHSDNAVTAHYPAEDIKTFTVPAGTILAEDTRGLHKGTHLITGDRLMLQLQFCNSFFGASIPSLSHITQFDSDFLDFAQKHRKIFTLFPLPEASQSSEA